jgi:hypothetical protein
MLRTRWIGVLLPLLGACSDNSDGNRQPPVVEPPEPPPPARVISDAADLLGGPLARGAEGDYLLENDLLRVIIQRPGRRWFGIGTYGGNIIDVSARKADGSFYPDHLEEFVTGVNIENTPNFTEVSIVNDGSNGEPAVICARGPDDLLDYINASSAIRDQGLLFPDSADDRDLPVEIETCYSLAADEPYVTLDTTLVNTTADDLPIYWVEYLSGSGQVGAFQPLAGFGEPQLTPQCPADRFATCDSSESGSCDPCNYVAYAGVDGAAGVSYGLIHDVPGSTTFSTDGVGVMVLGEAVFNIVLGIAPPNFVVPGDGELALRRWFAVGDGSAASIGDIRNTLLGYATGTLSGNVSGAGEPLAGAQVAVYQTLSGATDPPTLFMAGVARTDADGNYALTLPAGDYEVRANQDGYLFDPDDPRQVQVTTGESTTTDFELPGPGFLEVTVTDQFGPVPAKLQLVGFDPSPRLRNTVLTSQAGVFEDVNADSLPFGIAFVDFIDRNGGSGPLAVEPGDYQLVVSRGPRYSAFKQLVTIESGQTIAVQAELTRVIDTAGYVYGDFHVHGIDSPDSEVTREERIETYLAEDMDFFASADHDIRVDFSATIEAMGAADMIGTTVSSESTTFDYGHFNAWPTTVDPQQIGGGTLDWGRETQPGMDFPEYASYVLSPAEIYTGLKDDPLAAIVQINHIASHFGSGLGIDTGQVPPASTVDPARRRLDPALGNAFDDGFDSLEVWIGTSGRSGIISQMRGQNAGDWFNLINQGIVRTGVANSDSHDYRFTRISARNLIASEVTDPAELGDLAETLAATVKAGKVIGTNVPFVTFSAEGQRGGAVQRAGLGVDEDNLLAVDPGSDVTLRLHFSAPDWAQVDSVEFYINNQPQRTSRPNATARYGICPDAVVSRGDPGWQEFVVDFPNASAYGAEVTLPLTGISEDSWVVAFVTGNDGVSQPLFPVMPASLDPGQNQTLEDLIDGNLGEGGTPAFAFTNPLFIDVGGDGWQPPGVANGPCPAGPPWPGPEPAG